MDERGECELCVPESVLSQNDYAIDQLPACGNRLGGPDRDESAPRERRAGTLAFLSTMAIIATGAPAIAQDNYPTRPVKLIAPQAPGLVRVQLLGPRDASAQVLLPVRQARAVLRRGAARRAQVQLRLQAVEFVARQVGPRRCSA